VIKEPSRTILLLDEKYTPTNGLFLHHIPLQTPTPAQLKMASNSNASGNSLSNDKASLITEDEADRRIQALNASRDQRDSTPDSTDGLTAKLRALQPINGTPKRAKLTRLSSDNEFNPSNNDFDQQEQKPVMPISTKTTATTIITFKFNHINNCRYQPI